MMNLDISTTSAEQVLASQGKSFHWARRLLGSKHAIRATRLYRFCRYIDDLADEEKLSDLAAQRLLEVKQSIILGQSEHAIVHDGLMLINACQVNKNVVLDLVEGIASDTHLVRVRDETCLQLYCYKVAGTVGLMMCQILDTKDPVAYPFAIDLGIAMQLTNICRDIKMDALINRRYIPANLINQLEPESLICPNKQDKDEIKKAVAILLERAEHYYKSGEAGLIYLPLRAHLAILVAARVYREIGRKLKQHDYEYWHERIIVSTPRKVVITIQAFFCFVFSLPWRHHSKPDHAILETTTKHYSDDANRS